MLALAHRSGVTDADVARTLAGDEVVAGATFVVDRAAVFDASPDAVWPWLVQLGKGRAGWYLPSRIERMLIPRGRRAPRVIVTEHQVLTAGDRVADYGSADAEFEVVEIDAPRTLVYRSMRPAAKGAPWPALGELAGERTLIFSWAFTLEPLGPSRTKVHVRLRGRRGARKRGTAVVALLGGLFDWLTIAGMFAGLRERIAAARDTTTG